MISFHGIEFHGIVRGLKRYLLRICVLVLVQAAAAREGLYGLSWQSFSKKTLTAEFTDDPAVTVRAMCCVCIRGDFEFESLVPIKD